MVNYILLHLEPATDKKHKWVVFLYNKTTKRMKQIKFGAYGYTDWTLGATEAQREAYRKRHRKNENWGADAVGTKGFWASNLLWGESRNIETALKDIKNKYF